MRKVSRILPTCIRLAHAWMRFPDQRLGQMLLNAVGEDKLFHIEDDDLVEKVEQYVKDFALKP